MTDPVKARARSILATRLFVLLGCLVLLAILGLQTYLAIRDGYRIQQNEKIQQFIKTQAIRNHRATLVNREVSRRIQSCTTPGGKCFQDAQKRTAKAVVGINQGTLRVIVAALSCQADGMTTATTLAKCTARRAAK